MMYTIINLVFLAAAVIVAIAATGISRKRMHDTSDSARAASRSEVRVWGALAGTLIVMIVLTAVFDNIMILIGLVDYNAANISGLKIGAVPIEDFAYTVAVVILLPAVFNLIPPLKKKR